MVSGVWADSHIMKCEKWLEIKTICDCKLVSSFYATNLRALLL